MMPIVTAQQPRHFRVFVSSTFSDMMEERDNLVKFVFPELRKLCEQRQVTWGEVDLRWGVTDEQKADGKVLPICLEEIKRCRPYFIGVLGERYGWIPAEIPAELIEQENWLADHRDHSVTELEILHGVLLNPEMKKHAYFYFRDAKYADTLPADRQVKFRDAPTEAEIAQWGREEAEHRAAIRHEKLAALKRRIREQGLPVAENYSDPKALGQLVLRDMQALIDSLYPDVPTSDPLDREAAEHEAFAESRRRVYIGGDPYYQRLDEHAAGNGPPMVVLGESGGGKSALLANWAAHYRKQHPDDLIILHFVGASSSSTDWLAMLRRIMGEFKRRFNITQEIPDKPDELRSAFANWLHMAAAQGRVILILDGLNQLEDRDQAPDLVWLPPVIPANIRLIVSTLPGRPLDDLRTRNWPVMQVEPLRTDERQEFITKYLAQYTKALNPERVTRITSAGQTANPLYLRALLEELRVFGAHERLDERIGYYLAAHTVPELYGKILARWEEDYGGDTNLVGEAMSLLWAARRGLSESELLDMLGSNGQPLPRAVWSPLYLAASDSLVSRSGLLGFFHDFLREAVRAAYLPTPAHEHSAHLKIANYFAARELTSRKVDELPWQLAEAKEWTKLCSLLVDLEYFNAAWQASEWEVKQLWVKVQENSNLTIPEAYRFLSSAATEANTLWNISSLLHDMGFWNDALQFDCRLVQHYRNNYNVTMLQSCLGKLALTQFSRGELDAALESYREQEQLARENQSKLDLQCSLEGQAGIVRLRGELEKALALYRQQEDICRELGDKRGLLRSYGHQAIIHHAKHELVDAELLCDKQAQLCRETGDNYRLATCIAMNGLLSYSRGDARGALSKYREAGTIFRDLGYKYELVSNLGNQALALQDLGDTLGALQLYEEARRMACEIGDRIRLPGILNNEALLIEKRGDLDEALEILAKAERLCRDLGLKDDLRVNLGNQARIASARGDHRRASILLAEKAGICRELGRTSDLLACLNDHALVAANCGDIESAIRMHEEQERISRQLNLTDWLAISLVNRSLDILVSSDRAREAQLKLEEARTLAERNGLIGLVEQINSILESVRSKTNLTNE